MGRKDLEDYMASAGPDGRGSGSSRGGGSGSGGSGNDGSGSADSFPSLLDMDTLEGAAADDPDFCGDVCSVVN